MENEIERKFLIKELPDLSTLKPVRQIRYFLYNQNSIELRIQSKDNRFELERKTFISRFERTTEKLEISKEEFDLLKQLGTKAIIRDSYNLTQSNSIKIYKEDYTGLSRAEFEFSNSQELESFTPPSWV